MELYIMRHAEPLRPTEWDGSDSTRPLSERGKKDLSVAVEVMKKKGFLPKRILTSPLERAKQTADIVSTVQPDLKPEIVSELASGVKPKDIRDFVLSLAAEAPILLVGHMPDMAMFGASVVPDPSLMQSGMKPGDIWAIEPGDMKEGWGTGKLLWSKSIPDWVSES